MISPDFDDGLCVHMFGLSFSNSDMMKIRYFQAMNIDLLRN